MADVKRQPGDSALCAASSSSKVRKQASYEFSDNVLNIAHKVFCATVSDKTLLESKGGGKAVEYQFVTHSGLRRIFKAVFPGFASAGSNANSPINKLIEIAAARRFPAMDKGSGKKKAFKHVSGVKAYYRAELGKLNFIRVGAE